VMISSQGSELKLIPDASYCQHLFPKSWIRLKKAFAPEFLNRIDDIVIFEFLEKESINKIIDIELAYLYDRINKLGYKISIADKAKEFIVEKGWDEQYGARPLKRAIQKYIEDKTCRDTFDRKTKPEYSNNY